MKWKKYRADLKLRKEEMRLKIDLKTMNIKEEARRAEFKMKKELRLAEEKMREEFRLKELEIQTKKELEAYKQAIKEKNNEATDDCRYWNIMVPDIEGCTVSSTALYISFAKKVKKVNEYEMDVNPEEEYKFIQSQLMKDLRNTSDYYFKSREVKTLADAIDFICADRLKKNNFKINTGIRISIAKETQDWLRGDELAKTIDHFKLNMRVAHNVKRMEFSRNTHNQMEMFGTGGMMYQRKINYNKYAIKCFTCVESGHVAAIVGTLNMRHGRNK
ncbi:hypothetical protein HELRODRAFT_171429 [Helobdella robusta]|uniref:Uncharacterized protein n=1 Tax=Helobdella robusta TaxID=6412 RepID=T1F496_HELRO|nr:hypothetical protein HELRODRAFT_171429 [Helobdella robusta]ESO05759.1 hypothetical protein HELRODRAFT_171429 [Helobdella robusta]